MTITLEHVGRRIYLIGNTYPVKDQIRDAGAKWDPERKAWYVGSQRKEVAEKIVGHLAGQKSEDGGETVSLDARVIRGRAEYQGKTYYLLAHGWSQKTGKQYAKLAFRDGSRVFWASDASAVKIIKQYEEPRSINQLREYAEKIKDGGFRGRETDENFNCPVCARYCTCGTGTFCTHHHDGCDRCGEER